MNGIRRSTVACARSSLPAERYLVEWLPSWMSGERAVLWKAAAEESLFAHGMAALAVLAADQPGEVPSAACISRLARGFQDAAGGLLSDWVTAAMHGCGLSLPRRVGRLARGFHGNAEACVEQLFGDALRDRGLPRRMGVFLPVPPAGSLAVESGAGPRPITGVAALAVLARRCGPLYLPGRPIEPSLIDLSPGLLAFPSFPDPDDTLGGDAS
jgi:hypothetical protein